uniref:RT_RNaseH domain-containing protein n=1 Tax=Schistocephalus solidus TaxID=70667 RepID=A0A183SNG6_SCHSO
MINQDFTIFMDHKQLNLVLWPYSDKYNSREIDHLDFISQFTADIRHIDGTKSEVADMFFIPSLSALQLSQGIDLVAMAAEQRRVGCPGDELVILATISGLQLADVPLTTGTGTILCDGVTLFHPLFVPDLMRQAVFHTLHRLFHLGAAPHKSSSWKGSYGLA